MAVKSYNPTTASRRGMIGTDYAKELTANAPEKSLFKGINSPADAIITAVSPPVSVVQATNVAIV